MQKIVKNKQYNYNLDLKMSPASCLQILTIKTSKAFFPVSTMKALECKWCLISIVLMNVEKCWIALTCRGSTTRATQIITTTSSWDGQICGVTSPKPTVEKVTMQKYNALKRDRLFFPARSKCWIPHELKETERLQCSWWETEKKKE